MLNHVVHGIDPVYDQNSEILILGSFPSVKSREACFFYGHPRNRFWPVLAALRREPLPASTKEKRNFLLRNHIAVWDVIESCDIEGSSDSSIRNAVPNNLNLILKTASIRQIYTNGGVSAKLYDKYCLPFTKIPAGLLIGAAITGAYSKFLITPQYKSEAKLYVLSKETTLTSLADLQIGSQLTQDYKVLVGSRPVLQGVVDHMKLDMTYRELEKKLTIDNPNNTRILTLTIKDPNPYLAKSIVDEVANTASDYIGEIMEMVPPKLIEDGEVASEKASPNVLKNTIIGGILGLLLVCGIIVVRVILNDTVKSEEDVSKYLDLPVLAVIPKKDGNEDRKKGQGKQKKSRSTGRGAKAPEKGAGTRQKSGADRKGRGEN